MADVISRTFGPEFSPGKIVKRVRDPRQAALADGLPFELTERALVRMGIACSLIPTKPDVQGAAGAQRRPSASAAGAVAHALEISGWKIRVESPS